MDDDLWRSWERIIAEQGVIIDRPMGTTHPRFAEMIYPVDYGYLKNTIGGDGKEIDIFVGSTDLGLVGLLATQDAAKGDREIKLLWNLTNDEIEAVAAFLNRETMTASLIRRRDEALPSSETFLAFRDFNEIPDDFMSDRPLNIILEPGGVFDDEM